MRLNLSDKSTRYFLYKIFMPNPNGGLFSALLCEKEYQKNAIQTSCFFLKTNHRLDSANGENAQAYYFSVIIFLRYG